MNFWTIILFILLVLIISTTAYSTLTYKNNTYEKIEIQCIGENLIIENATCYRLFYHCNKIQKFHMKNCIENVEEIK